VKPRADIAAERIAIFGANAEICSARARLGEAVLIVMIIVDADARLEDDDARVNYGSDAGNETCSRRGAVPVAVFPAKRMRRVVSNVA